MSLFNQIVGAVTSNAQGQGNSNALLGVCESVLANSGGLQGLMGKFSQAGLGNVFSSWVGTGQNQPISAEQIQQALGSDQVKALAAKLGFDPAQVSQMVAQCLPQAVDHLTPNGQIDPNANMQQGLSGLLQKFTTPQPNA
jgi:uncharacterized protein YidB (DUF937 family)